MFEEMEKEDMFILNRDTFQNGRGGQKRFECRLDLWLKQDSVQERYNQKDDSWGNDHFFVEFEIQIKMDEYKKKTNRISKKKTRWEYYVIQIEKRDTIKKRDTIEKREDQLDMEEYKNANPEEKYKLRTL